MSRPYFETKVVKVKKENKCKLHIGKCKSCNFNGYCVHQMNNEKPKGNWFNGENLDKIKFPCFCSYIKNNNKRYAILVKNEELIFIINVEKQNTTPEYIISREYFDILIKEGKIHILKGKIIIFEEE